MIPAANPLTSAARASCWFSWCQRSGCTACIRNPIDQPPRLHCAEHASAAETYPIVHGPGFTFCRVMQLPNIRRGWTAEA